MDGYAGSLSCDNISIGGRCNCTRVGEVTIVDGGDSGAERRGVGTSMTEGRWGFGVNGHCREVGDRWVNISGVCGDTEQWEAWYRREGGLALVRLECGGEEFILQ